MKLIVGLGNPGREYEKTRHNIGFNVLDLLADKYNITFSENKKFNALEASFNLMGEKVILVKPLTFMNLSGDSVIKYINYYDIDVNDLLVIHDDLDMELGKIRIVFDSSSGGHNGIKSIINNLNSQKFTRLKIGISHNKNIDTKDYVLGKFKGDDWKVLTDSYNKVLDIVENFISKDVNTLKQIYSNKNKIGYNIFVSFSIGGENI